MRAYLKLLDDEQVNQVVAYHTNRRGPCQNIAWEILIHVVNHGTDHRAQVLALLHRSGAPTFEQDLMIYLWD